MELVTIKSKPTDVRPGWKKEDGSTHWKCVLKYEGRKMRAGFSMGAAHEGEPEAEGVLSCLLSDAHAGQESFHDFCGNFGEDEDSIKARRSWHACRKTGVKLKEFLGPEMWEKSKHVNSEEFAKFMARGTTVDPVKPGEKATDWIEFTIEDRHGSDKQFRVRLVYGFDIPFAISVNQSASFHANTELQELNEGVEVWTDSHLDDVMDRIPKEVRAKWESLKRLNGFHADRGPWYYNENTVYWFEIATGLRPRSKDEQMPQWLRKIVDSDRREKEKTWGKDHAVTKRCNPSEGQWFLVFKEYFESSCCFGLLDPEPPFPWAPKTSSDPHAKLSAKPDVDFPRPHRTALWKPAEKEELKQQMVTWLKDRHAQVIEAGWAILTAEGFDREAVTAKKVSP